MCSSCRICLPVVSEFLFLSMLFIGIHAVYLDIVFISVNRMLPLIRVQLQYILFQFTDNYYMTRADCVAMFRSLLKIVYHEHNGKIPLMHNPSASFAEREDERVQFENCANSFPA